MYESDHDSTTMSEQFSHDDELEQIHKELNAVHDQRSRIAFTGGTVVVDLHAGEDHVEMFKAIESVTEQFETDFIIEMVSPTSFHVKEDER